jgi:hypothetical protein
MGTDESLVSWQERQVCYLYSGNIYGYWFGMKTPTMEKGTGITSTKINPVPFSIAAKAAPTFLKRQWERLQPRFIHF